MFGFVPKAKFDEHTEKFDRYAEKFDQYVEKLELELSNAKKRIGELEETVNWRSALFFKAFAVAGLKGDYLEFGVFRGATLSDAFWCARRHADLFLGGAWDHSMADAVREKAIFQRDYEAMRFIGFDSFEGLPAISGVDAERPTFKQGTYAAGKDIALNNLRAYGVDLERVHLVPGYFNESCTPETAAEIGIKEVAVVHIDSDLYSSAVTALDFCEPYLRDGSVIIFDEWFQFGGSPKHGEQRAFAEWQLKYRHWYVAELGRESFGRVAFVLNRR